MLYSVVAAMILPSFGRDGAEHAPRTFRLDAHLLPLHRKCNFVRNTVISSVQISSYIWAYENVAALVSLYVAHSDCRDSIDWQPCFAA